MPDSLPGNLRGREILLAGASSGIGLATAELLARDEARLLLSYRSRPERLADWHGRAQVLHADLASAQDRRKLLDCAPRLYGLVVFAGDPARVKDPAEAEVAMRRSHEVNYLGPILLAREAAERMKAAAMPGAIVLIGTMQSVALFTGSTAYAAQKAALSHAARILAKECRGPANVRVNVVSPGVTDTGMAQASIASGKYNRFLEEHVVGRFGQAEDVARAVRFFLQPDNYITGQVLSVDGGITL